MDLGMHTASPSRTIWCNRSCWQACSQQCRWVTGGDSALFCHRIISIISRVQAELALRAMISSSIWSAIHCCRRKFVSHSPQDLWAILHRIRLGHHRFGSDTPAGSNPRYLTLFAQVTNPHDPKEMQSIPMTCASNSYYIALQDRAHELQ